MKLDTSSYYPKSPLDDDPEFTPGSNGDASPGKDSGPEEIVDAEVEVIAEVAACEEAGSDEHEPELPPTEGEKAVNTFCTALSWIFVPLLMPVYGTLLAFGLSILSFTAPGVKLAFIAIVFGFNVVIPAIVVMLLKKAGVINDIGLNNQQERFLPYMVCILCLVGTALFMAHKHAPLWLVMFYYGGAAAGMVEVVINRWWKISVHAAGVAGIVALLMHILLGDYCASQTMLWLLISVGVAGLVGSARIWMQRHTLWQVLAGYVVGFCGVFFLMMV